MSKVMVTGANGYLGRGIVTELLECGNEVVATDVNVDGIDKRATKIACDLFSVEDPYHYFGEPDILLHLAWRDGFVHYSEAHLLDLPKHYNFLKDLTDTEIKTIAVMGSMHEVGFFEGSIDENTPCRPESFYGIAKNALREVTAILTKQKNETFMWLRGFYIVGNSQYGSSVFSKISAAVERGDKEFPFTMGLNQFDFLDYDVFCKYVSAAITQDKVNGIINICSGRPERLSDRVERFIKENDYNIKLKYGAFPDRPYDSKAIWGNDTKIKSIMEGVSTIIKK